MANREEEIKNLKNKKKLVFFNSEKNFDFHTKHTDLQIDFDNLEKTKINFVVQLYMIQENQKSVNSFEVEIPKNTNKCKIELSTTSDNYDLNSIDVQAI